MDRSHHSKNVDGNHTLLSYVSNVAGVWLSTSSRVRVFGCDIRQRVLHRIPYRATRTHALRLNNPHAAPDGNHARLLSCPPCPWLWVRAGGGCGHELMQHISPNTLCWHVLHTNTALCSRADGTVTLTGPSFSGHDGEQEDTINGNTHHQPVRARNISQAHTRSHLMCLQQRTTHQPQPWLATRSIAVCCHRRGSRN